MKISELKAIEPKAEVYEMRPEARYIVVVPPHWPDRVCVKLGTALREAGLDNFAIAIGGFEIFELQNAPQN